MNTRHRDLQFVFENLWEEDPYNAQTAVDFLPAYPLLYDLTPSCGECGCSFGVAVVRSIAFPVRHRATIAFQCNDCGRTLVFTDAMPDKHVVPPGPRLWGIGRSTRREPVGACEVTSASTSREVDGSGVGRSSMLPRRA